MSKHRNLLFCLYSFMRIIYVLILNSFLWPKNPDLFFLSLVNVPVNMQLSQGPGWRLPSTVWLVQMREHLLSWRKKCTEIFCYVSHLLHQCAPNRTQGRMGYFRETQAAPWRLPQQTNHLKWMLFLKHKQVQSQSQPQCWETGGFTLWHDSWSSQTARGAHSVQQLLYRKWRLKSEQKSHHQL